MRAPHRDNAKLHGTVRSVVSKVISTWRAILAPRRLFAIVVLAAPMLFVQARYSYDEHAVPVALALLAAFLLTAPALWRVLFPYGAAPRGEWLRALVFGAAGIGIVGFFGGVVPILLGMSNTFLTNPATLLVVVALYWVGGGGLGRDIDLEERTLALEEEAEHAQLLALRSHLDPHFLFNTLNAIAEWCRQDGEIAERAILQLSQMLRTVMSGIRLTSWPLEREVELVDTLLALHLIRDPDLFRYQRDIAIPMPHVHVPPMLLLPLVENAMKHGPSRGHRGEVRVGIVSRDGTLTIEIENPGTFSGSRDGGEGLAIVRRRVALAYGPSARFTIEGRGERTLATVELPARGPAA